MAEGITFNPTGTVTIDIGKPYVLKRPKLREYRYFRDLIRELSIEAVDTMNGLQKDLEGVEEGTAEFSELESEIRHIGANSFELTSIPWLKSVFEQLGDPLPDDHEEWPAWLAADQTIPTKIINHWRDVPLAPGEAGTN